MTTLLTLGIALVAYVLWFIGRRGGIRVIGRRAREQADVDLDDAYWQWKARNDLIDEQRRPAWGASDTTLPADPNPPEVWRPSNDHDASGQNW